MSSSELSSAQLCTPRQYRVTASTEQIPGRRHIDWDGVGLGALRPARPCTARPCPSLPGPARPCPALPGPARPCPALPIPARSARPCPARPCPPCPALPSPARTVPARPARPCPAQPGPHTGGIAGLLSLMEDRSGGKVKNSKVSRPSQCRCDTSVSRRAAHLRRAYA